MRRFVGGRLGRDRGQTLVETALVLPLFILVVVGVITLGIGLFYQQQVANAAREVARYAAIHSATSTEPTCSWRDVNVGMVPDPAVLTSTTLCDPAKIDDVTPANPQWPKMQAYGRENAGFGFDESDLHFAACWSGYVDAVNGAIDAAPIGEDTDGDGTLDANPFARCTVGGIDPISNTGALSCPPPLTSASDDKASNLAVSSGGTSNQVTVYACYAWRPPMAGFLLIPETVTLRATITQSLQHQR